MVRVCPPVFQTLSSQTVRSSPFTSTYPSRTGRPYVSRSETDRAGRGGHRVDQDLGFRSSAGSTFRASAIASILSREAAYFAFSSLRM